MERYKAFVRRNAGLLSLFETGLSSLTWVLPERFEGGELSIEALHTALGLMSGFHDSIVSTPPGGVPPPGADLTLALSTLEQVQVLLELIATRHEERGGGSRYTSLSILEAIKALVRLVIWRRSGSRLLLHGGVGNFEQQLFEFAGLDAAAQGRPQEVIAAFSAFRQRRCQLTGKQGDASTSKAAALGPAPAGSSKAGGKGSGSRGPSLSGQAARSQRLVATAEVLHIMRPVAYALALRRWGRRSWKPWLVSLVVDLLSMRLGSAGAAAVESSTWFGSVQPSNLGPSLLLLQSLQQTRWAPEEERELEARRMRMLVYLLRDPVFSRYTQAALEKWVRGTSRVPLVGWLSGRSAEILMGVQQYYTYIERMAAS